MAGPTLSPCSETLSENGINQEETETREGERERNRIPWSSLVKLCLVSALLLAFSVV